MKKRNYYLIIGLILVGIVLIATLAGKYLVPYEPTQMSASEKFNSPSPSHFMGTDRFGRDVFSRVAEGTGTTFLIALSTVGIGLVLGTIIGAFTGYFGGWIDEILMRINDAIAAFPSILLALVIIAIIGSGKYNVIIALGILFIPSFARIVRAEFIRCKNLDYVKSAKLMGAGPFRIMFVHILPNTFPVMLSSLAIGFNNAVLAEASMSYLGIGVLPPDASLGYMLSEAQSYILTAPWCAIFPGLTIILLILGMSMVGEGVRERLGD